MPIYKVNGKKDGLQKYKVRINYITEYGKAKQLTRVTYGVDNAKNLERTLNTEIKDKGKMPIRKMTVGQLFDEYIEVKKYEVKALTIANLHNTFRNYILPTYKNCFIDKITVKSIREWKLELEKRNLAVGTKKIAFANFKGLIKFAVNMDYLTKNPLEKVSNFKDRSMIKKNINYYTIDEFNKYINTIKELAIMKQKNDNDLSEWNYYVFFNIAFYTGLRKGEIHALKWSDINGAYLSVSRSITQILIGEDRETSPKNKSSIRTIQIPLPLIEVLEEQKKRQKRLKNFSYDFRVCGGEKCLRNGTIINKNIIYANKSNLKIIRIHDFRHSHASVLANKGINIQVIARRLGHSRIEMTWNTYSHLYPKEEERAVNVFNTPLK